MTEQDIQAKVIRYLKDRNIYHFKVISANKNGVPDLLICLQGQFVAIEFKQPGKEPTEIQKYNIRRIHKSKGIAFIASDAEATIDVINSLNINLNKKDPLHYLKAVVAKITRVSVSLIDSDSRTSATTLARHIFYWFAIKHGYTMQEIANSVNKKDHTHVLSAFNKIEAILDSKKPTPYTKRVCNTIREIEYILKLPYDEVQKELNF